MKWRFRFILFLFIISFLVIDARLYYWQVVRADELSSMGRSQYNAEVKTNALRGDIKTSDGFTIAANRISYLMYANPKVVKDKENVASILSPLLKVESASLSASLSRDSLWSPLKSRIDDNMKNKIASLKLEGLGFQDEDNRYYPEASMAAQVLGFVGRDKDGNPQGYFGLEGYYDRQLRGKEGISLQTRDAWGNPMVDSRREYSSKVDGRTLKLHIDRSVQYILEQELKNGIARYGAESGTAGIIDPKTGGVVAMASFPTFDPGSYQDYSEEVYKNVFISDMYEPGSTFKPFVMAAALDTGVIKPDTICTICEGPQDIGGYTIRTWNDKYNPGSTMTDVIVHSDNIGMVYVGQKLGHDRIRNYFEKFGFDGSTGIDLQGEAASTLRPKDSWHAIDFATATFGQGITVTPIQLLSAFAAIGNEGKRMEPHLVDTIETSDGALLKIQPKIVSQPIFSKTAKIMTEMLVSAVDNGEAKWAKPKGYRIAGKTGTAQIALAGHYDPNKTIASFIGFAPADDPKFTMLIILNKPSTSIYGAETAAPIFFNIAKKLLTYYNIPPTEPVITTPELPLTPTPDLSITPESTGSASP